MTTTEPYAPQLATTAIATRARTYVWPHTNKWEFDHATGAYRQSSVRVKPIYLDAEAHRAFPGFIAVELLGPGGGSTDTYNFVLPGRLYADDGRPIHPLEALALLEANLSRCNPSANNPATPTTKSSRARSGQ
jgi:hypothetical protein